MAPLNNSSRGLLSHRSSYPSETCWSDTISELAIGKIGCFSYFKRNEPRLTSSTVFLKFILKGLKIRQPPFSKKQDLKKKNLPYIWANMVVINAYIVKPVTTSQHMKELHLALWSFIWHHHTVICFHIQLRLVFHKHVHIHIGV
jgi:hypothetical protein